MRDGWGFMASGRFFPRACVEWRWSFHSGYPEVATPPGECSKNRPHPDASLHERASV
jgi:hypothetical protein